MVDIRKAPYRGQVLKPPLEVVVRDCKDVVCRINKRGVMSIADRADPTQAPYLLDANAIITYEVNEDGINLIMGYGKVVTLMLFPLPAKDDTDTETMLRACYYDDLMVWNKEEATGQRRLHREERFVEFGFSMYLAGFVRGLESGIRAAGKGLE